MHEDQPKSRGSMRLALHRCPKTNMYRSSFEFQGASLYNHLPDCVKNTTKNTFLSVLEKLSHLHYFIVSDTNFIFFIFFTVFSVHVWLFVLLWQDQYEKPSCVLWILHSCVNKIKFYLSIYNVSASLTSSAATVSLSNS